MRTTASRLTSTLTLALAMHACGTLSVFSSPEGNVTIAPSRAAAGATGPGGTLRDRGAPAPAAHVARSAFDRWRPADIGILPPTGLRDRPAVPMRVSAGPLEFTLRFSDARAPSWGGDTYVRVDVRAAGNDQRPARDIVVLIDTRDETSLRRSKNIAAELFETLREGDHGALVTTDEGGRVRVGLLSYGAAPLLIERTRALQARGGDDLTTAVERAVAMLANRGERIAKLAVLSGHGGLISGETVAAIARAQEANVEVVLVPLTEAAAHRFEPAAMRAGAIALARVAANEQSERALVDELATLPPAEPAARDVSLLYEAIPAPSHLIDVFGGASAWTPSGGEIPLGTVRPGDTRTLVLRVGIPSHTADGAFEPTVRVRWRDALGPHEVRASTMLPYAARPSERDGARAGDVLHYVSMLGTISAIHRALESRDATGLEAMTPAASEQARAMLEFGDQRGDRVMSAQARLLRELVASAQLR